MDKRTAAGAKLPPVEAETEADKPALYLGVGASAGGLEAIEALFAEMPSDANVAFVVIQHLSPDYKSMMVELLSKRTLLPVIQAEDGLLIKANTIYIIPPKVNLTIFHGKLLFSPQEHNRGLNLPIDIFLRSLAEDQRSRSAAVILSGTGSDGMRGVRAVKEAGGMVMVQSAESAKFDGMPRSAISTGLADFILPADQMADQIAKFVCSPHTARENYSTAVEAAETEMDRIFAMLRDQHKVDFTHYKPSTVNRRIERRMIVNQTEGLKAYVKLLERSASEQNALYRELLIGVTGFFRDPEVFDYLRESAIPMLLEKLPKKAYRVWIAGCSTGEEAYSLAILLRECLDAAGSKATFKIFATDIDQNAILKAANGIYPASLIADLPIELQQKYFRSRENDFQVSRELREHIVFAQHNVISDPPFTNVDLISCRNLLIYFESVLQEKVQDFFNFSLNQGGILLLGSSETPGQHMEVFEPLSQRLKIYRSKGMRSTRAHDDMVPRQLFSATNPSIRPVAGGARHTRLDLDDSRFLERLLQTLVGDLIPMVIVVNEQLDLIYSLGKRPELLAVPSGRLQYGISKMLPRELSIPLTTSVQRAFREEEDVAFTNIQVASQDASSRLNLRVKLLSARKTQERLAAVIIEDAAPSPSLTNTSAESSFDYESGVQQRISDLEQELQFSKENLQATIEELETSNEELQATNEELLASNEELQSTNEELQSVNEELHTVNSEHQHKILELTEMTNDFDNLLGNIRQAIVFLDENLEIRKFTPEAESIFQIRTIDIGRPLENMNHCLEHNSHPFVYARQVLEGGDPIETTVNNKEGRTFIMRALPYQISPNHQSGVILVFSDISKVKTVENELAESQRRLHQAATLAKIGSWEFTLDTSKVTWSEEVYHIHDKPLSYKPVLEEGLDFYAPKSRPTIEKVFTAARDEGTPWDEVLEIISAKGAHKWIRTIGVPEMKDGRVIRITGAFQDISRVKQMEQSLADHEADHGRST